MGRGGEEVERKKGGSDQRRKTAEDGVQCGAKSECKKQDMNYINK